MSSSIPPAASSHGSPAGAAPPPVRLATLDDLDGLVALEEGSFEGDRTTRRQFRHLLTRGNAALLVVPGPGGKTGGRGSRGPEETEGLEAPDAPGTPDPLLGSAVVLFSRGTATARVYSVAVAPEARGQGVGRRLLERAEAEAWERERAWMRAEIRQDNTASIRLFESLGYRRFGEYADYYEDHMAAWRYEKALDDRLKPVLARVPYYPQTLDFTCGPAALVMAMKSLEPELQPDRAMEIRLWREATTVYMTAGHGGCGPYGLALAAHRRGFPVEVVVSSDDVHLVDTVRSAEKKEVMRVVQEDMRAEMERREIPLAHGRLSVDELERRFHGGEVPLVLISSWQIYEEKAPHWVVVTGFDEHFVYVHDPWIDRKEGETAADSMNMPIGRSQFARMVRYGRSGLQAVVFLGAGES